jgi:hypothetical protein
VADGCGQRGAEIQGSVVGTSMTIVGWDDGCGSVADRSMGGMNEAHVGLLGWQGRAHGEVVTVYIGIFHLASHSEGQR